MTVRADAASTAIKRPQKKCVKLRGQRLLSRDFDRQVAEVLIHATTLNRFRPRHSAEAP